MELQVLEERVHSLEMEQTAMKVRLDGVSKQAEQVGPLTLAITRVEGEIRGIKDWMTTQITNLHDHVSKEASAVKDREDATSRKLDGVIDLHGKTVERQERDRKQIKVALIGATAVITAALIGFAAVLVAAGSPV